ncbi:integrase domain-containing protein [Vibrio metschnikovii]|uniref:integrase domain-containing protein n=1 Tax=Vibrio metschnikovii TaxID=28172 RepID=UPI00164CA48C|nr:integrase domain-containing protein [Vibrio metschnikovii]MBC5831901.1 tyrosine-type recombinase/integrase [Vibrio metschnikovii]
MAKVRQKLTAKEVANAKSKDKPYRLGDGGGLYLLIRPSGFKAWECRYMKPNTGKATFSGLGSYPDVSLAEARDKATEIRKMVADNIDPKLLKAEQRAKTTSEMNSTFKVVADLWIDTKRHRIKPKTIEGNWRKLELYAFPSIGGVPISKITAPMAIAALKPIEKTGHLETVKRTAQLMNEVMTYAVNAGLIHSNPLSGIKEVFRKPKVQHMLALQPHELPELVQTVARANMAITTKCLIEWQLNTMTRPNEAAGARWSEIDIDNAVWTIPASRMKMNKEHQIPLTTQTLAILEVVRPISGHREFVFPSIRDPKKPTDAESINKALGRIGFKGRTTAHGLRSLASTTLNEQGFNADVIEAALAHTDRNAIRKAYNRTSYFEQRRPLMKWWSDHIEQASYGSLSVTGLRQFKVV